MSGTVASDSDFLAPVLSLEHHQAEDSHQRYDNGQSGEQQDDTGCPPFFSILGIEPAVKERNFEFILWNRRIKFVQSGLYPVHEDRDVGSRLSPDIECVECLPGVLAENI